MHDNARISAFSVPAGGFPKFGHVGLGYTIATGRLFCRMDVFHPYAEWLLDRPIFTHEFALEETWDALRRAFEERASSLDEEPAA